MARLDEAIKFATDAHVGQVDRAGEPYILHPLRVMLSVSTDDERIAAVLHDVVEDNPHVGHRDILALFGPIIHEAVFALTRQDGEVYADFIARCSLNPIARKVKLADIDDNLAPWRSSSLTESLRARYEAARAAIAGGAVGDGWWGAPYQPGDLVYYDTEKGGSLNGQFRGLVEGWYEIVFADGSTAICSPSRVRPRPTSPVRREW